MSYNWTTPAKCPAGTRILYAIRYGQREPFEGVVDEWSPSANLVKINGHWQEPPYLVEVLPADPNPKG